MTRGSRISVLTRRRDERGSMALEFAMIAPSFLLLFALIFAYGKTGQVHGLLDSGTRDAARSATDARSLDEARQDATSALKQALEDAPASCRSSARIEIEGAFEPGNPITAVGTCTYSLRDVGLPGAPGSLSPTSRFTSMLDPNRGTG